MTTKTDYEGTYRHVVDRAFALEPGKSFVLKAGEFGNYGLFVKRTKPEIAAKRVRVKLHQFSQAKRKKIRVRLEPDMVNLQIYREA